MKSRMSQIAHRSQALRCRCNLFCVIHDLCTVFGDFNFCNIEDRDILYDFCAYDSLG